MCTPVCKRSGWAAPCATLLNPGEHLKASKGSVLPVMAPGPVPCYMAAIGSQASQGTPEQPNDAATSNLITKNTATLHTVE